MASIVAYIELRQGTVTDASRFVLAEARRVADTAGATVFALLTVGRLDQGEIDLLASEINAAGADRVLCASAETLGGPPLDATHGEALTQVAEQLRPLLVLFPAGGSAVQLGPPLAIRIGAAFMASASIELRSEDRTPEPPSHRVLLARWRAARDGQRKIDVGDLERPVVAGLPAGPIPAPTAARHTEVEMVAHPAPKFSALSVATATPDSCADLESCRQLIWCGPASPAATAELRRVLPTGTCLVTEADAGCPALVHAAPEDVLVLPSATLPLTSFVPRLAPSTRVVLVSRDSNKSPAPETSSAATSDGELTTLAALVAAAKESS